jgi:hypothetical protein
MKITRFRKTQVFRVVTQGVHFFATAGQIRNGVGDEYVTNASIQKALDALEYTRSGNDLGAISTGLAGEWESRRVQLDMIDPRTVIRA